jgi:hypothetical protein
MADSVTITAAEFAVIFQLTKELPNLPSGPLAEHGFSSADAEYFSEMRAAFRALADSYSRVRFEVSAKESAEPGSCRFSGVLISASENPDDGVLAIADMPNRIASLWPHVLDLVVSFLGDRELFLRTGSHSEEARRAIDLLRMADR